MRVVTGVVGNDIHVVANRLIEISLKERRFEVLVMSKTCNHPKNQTTAVQNIAH
jgi:hypothetical protein